MGLGRFVECSGLVISPIKKTQKLERDVLIIRPSILAGSICACNNIIIFYAFINFENDIFKVKIDTLRSKLKNAQKMKKMPRLLHAQIKLAQIDGLIMRLSRPRAADKKIIWAINQYTCILF